LITVSTEKNLDDYKYHAFSSKHVIRHTQKWKKPEELITLQKQPAVKTPFEEKLNMNIVTSNSSLYKSADMDYLLQNLIFVSLTVPTLQHDINVQIPIAIELLSL